MNRCAVSCVKRNFRTADVARSPRTTRLAVRHIGCDECCAMTMLDWNAKQRALVADKLFDFGNVAAGAMIFGQFVADRPFSVLLGVTGFASGSRCSS